MTDQKNSFLVRLMSPLSYTQKFLLIFCCFIFSIAVSNLFLIREQNDNIKIAKDELQDLSYQRPLRKLLENIPKYFFTVIYTGQSQASAKIELMALQSQINTDFKNLQLVSHGKDILLLTYDNESNLKQTFSSEVDRLEKKWGDLVEIPIDKKQVDGQEIFVNLVSDIATLMNRMGEIIEVNDPDLNTYYLVKSLVTDLPRAQSMITISSLYLDTSDAKLKRSQRDSIVKMIALLKLSLSETKIGLDKIFSYENRGQKESESETRLKDSLSQFLTDAEEFIEVVDKNILETNELKLNWQDLLSLEKKTMQASFNFWDVGINQLENLLQIRLDNYRLQQRVTLFIEIVSVLIGFLIGYITMRNISTPLSELVGAAKKLAEGDLSARVPVLSKDELGQVGEAFNQMADSFQELIGQLQWTGIQLTTSTTEIAATAKQQEATIVEQEATTKEIAATAREISATSKDFAKTMNEVSSTAEQTSALASSGKSGLQRMETIMRQMVDAAGNIASKLAVLNEKASSITSIITTIAKVADQTNLLSLNAAIEAEKAGEYGRSFSVIAREIRRLADQTANATLDIEKMVNEIVSAVSAGVMGVDKFSEEINTGVKQVSIVSEQLTKIIEQVQQQTSSFETVNQGMQAQTLGAEQINEAINQLSEAAQQTTESIRQFHSAIEQLNNAAQEMQNAVSRIKR